VTTLNRRRGVALVALIGLFVSTYLFLYALGFYGALVCGAGGGCSLVQASRWAKFLGFPVAGWGVLWYGAVLVASLLAVQTGLGRTRWVAGALFLLAAGGVAFTIYLTALELFVIHAICRWCVGSAVMTLVIFVLAVPEWKLARSPAG
jgi:uncharacterized membrane protein